MKLFEHNKKKQPQNTEKPKRTEFKTDVTEILHKTGAHNRKDVCELEYVKAINLLKNPTQQTISRASQIMRTLATDFDYLPAALWMAEFSVNGIKNPEQAALWYKKAADLGSGKAAYCLGNILTEGRGVTKNTRLAVEYYAEAAKKGVADAAFALGEYYMKKGNRIDAADAYKKALDGGCKKAGAKLEKLKNKS